MLRRAFLLATTLAFFAGSVAASTSCTRAGLPQQMSCVDLDAALMEARSTAPVVALSGTRQQIEEALGTTLVAHFATHGLEAELLSVSWLGASPESNTSWRLKVRPGAGSLTRRISLQVELQALHGGEPLLALVSMRAQAKVLVATGRIARNTEGSCALFRTAQVDVGTLASSHVLTACTGTAPLHVARHFEAGEAVLPDDVVMPYAVRAQEPVRIQVSAGKVRLESGGIALDSARIGDTVAVRPSHSTHAIRGRVVEPRLVVLEDTGS